MVPGLTDPLIFYGILGAAGLIVIFAVYVYLKKRQESQSAGNGKTSPSRAERLAYQPETRPIPAVPQKAIPRPVQKPASSLPQPKDTSILNGRGNISESLHALVEKYSLDDFTIATSDGLVFASGGGESAQTDAARYSEIYACDPLSETPGIILSGLNHKGSDLILIMKTPLSVPDSVRQNIENDTKDILNWWI